MEAGVALATELAIAASRGRVTAKGDLIVVETASEPGWLEGNYLHLPRAPRPGELAELQATFVRELGAQRALSLRWDDPALDPAAAEELRVAGLEVETLDVMTADDVLAPPHALAMRVLAPVEVAATADLSWAIADRHDQPYRDFLKGRAAWQQRLVEADRAHFFGAFDAGKLVASLGVFFTDKLGRYQDVQTLASHRRRGVAGALLAAAARETRSRCKRFVIFAQHGSEAQRVYTRVGFTTTETSTRASRYPTTARLTK